MDAHDLFDGTRANLSMDISTALGPGKQIFLAMQSYSPIGLISEALTFYDFESGRQIFLAMQSYLLLRTNALLDLQIFCTTWALKKDFLCKSELSPHQYLTEKLYNLQ